MTIIDCFPFFNELDLLEIRLNSLVPYVEKFVLCESPTTHSGNPKPLYFNDNKERFKNFNIIHLIADPGMTSDNWRDGSDSWKREFYQRNFLINGILSDDLDSIVLISDVDEIPDLKGFNGTEGVFNQRMYYYWLDVDTGLPWRGTISVLRKNITSMSNMRNHVRRMKNLSFGGWHFSTLGTSTQIVEKIESFAHQELNTNERKEKIAENRRNLVDPYNRNLEKFTVRMPSGPQWLLDNKDRYKHLFYKA